MQPSLRPTDRVPNLANRAAVSKLVDARFGTSLLVLVQPGLSAHLKFRVALLPIQNQAVRSEMAGDFRTYAQEAS
jgi:hypothetical protein